MNRKFLFIPLLIILVGAAVLLLWRPWAGEDSGVISGYVEGEPLYISAASSGFVAELDVERGDRVNAGARLFQIDPQVALAQTEAARAAAEAAQAEARDTAKGQRPEELAIIAAQRQSADAVLAEARADFARVSTLTESGVYSQARLDAARAELGVAESQYAEITRRLDAAELGARQDRQTAARARTDQARAQVAENEQRLGQLSPTAPVAARVEDVYYRPGEWAPANQPIVSLLPDDMVKIRFFVAEADLPAYQTGNVIEFGCDGCEPQSATISFVSPRAEFTPPVLYNRDQRQRLVFLIEARPQNPRVLAPGQPVDVTPLPTPAAP